MAKLTLKAQRERLLEEIILNKQNAMNLECNLYNARVLMDAVEAKVSKLPTILQSIKEQLKNKRTISERQFKIIKENLI